LSDDDASIKKTKYEPDNVVAVAPKLPPKIEKAIETVAPALVTVDPDTAPRDLLNRFVCRIFNDGELYYGYLVSYHKGYYQASATTEIVGNLDTVR
jgi:hypothetical protein